MSLQKEKVIFNNTEVKRNKHYLKNKISYLPQDSFILDTSIKENIAFGEVNPDDEKIRYCIDISNLKNFIDGLPNEINTLVVEVVLSYHMDKNKDLAWLERYIQIQIY